MAETETFQHYQVLKHPDGSLWELGRGAMGVTYKAFDTSLRCQVALKVINAAFLDSDMARQRFLREARAAAGLSHSNVASVFHLGEESGNYFYAMEFIAGETLEAFVRRHGPLSPGLALKITLQVARALRAASREGLVHRDIKPANLMLVREDDETEEGDDLEVHVKVIDFGLAKVARQDGADSSATITVAGFVGTPHFASPEQLEEKTLDVRSDIYSLGVTLWYMIIGRPVFGGSMVQIMSQHLTREPAFEQLRGTSAAVVSLLKHMLQKDPAKRPQTALELRREIEAAARALGGDRTRVPEPAIPTAAGSGGPAADASPESTFATLAATDGDPASSSNESTPTAPATGTILAGHYRLLRTVSEGPRGVLFQALELDHGRPVALKVLPANFLAEPESLRRAETLLAQARAALHPSLLELYSLERNDTRVFLTSEWVNGFTLVELLRHRRSLPLDEALRCLEPLAAAADHVQRSGLRDPDFSPAQVLLAFEATLDLPAQSALLNQPLARWPGFRPKVYPFAVASLDQGPEATWSGMQTVVPAAALPGATRQLALLAYELLGGSAAPLSPTPARAPLPALTESGNAVLKRALANDGSPAFALASDFVKALRDSASGTGAMPTAPRVSPPAPEVAAMPASPAVAPAPGQAPPPLPPPTPAPATAMTMPANTLPRNVAAAPPKPPAERSGLPILAVGSLLLGLIVLGILGGAFYAARKVNVASDGRNAGEKPATHHRVPSPGPTAATPLPTPLGTPLAVTPAPTPAPTPERGFRAKELLAEADTLDRAGDIAGALNGYVQVAQDYPEADPGLSRLDSFVARLRGKPLDEANDGRRLATLRAPMEAAAHLGSDAAMLFLGEHLLATEPGAAAEWYRQAADKGQPEAMLALGDMYFRGTGVPLEPAQASRWYQLASDKGYPKAKVYLAECYEMGKAGLSRNYDKSFQLLNEALTLDPNNAQATEKLAEEYERGRGTAPDTFRAFTLMKRAVDLGNTAAIGNLGTYYMRGYGQNADPRMAAALFKEGMAKGDARCIFFYAQCVENGLGGIPANPSGAISYYRASAERGFPPARDWCNQHRVSFAPAARVTP